MDNKKIITVLIVLVSVLAFSGAIAIGQSVPDSYTHSASANVLSGIGSTANMSSSLKSVPSQLKSYENYFNSSVNRTMSGNPFFSNASSWNTISNAGSNLSSKYLFLPNFHASDMYSMVNGVVHPLYSQAPAPMGIGDIGVKNVSGALVGYNYNTSSFEGTVAMNNLTPLYLLNDAPSTVSIQLNTVLNNVTLFGVSHYDFWTQNVIVYSARTHTLRFEDNLWNFSSPNTYLTSNAIYNSTGVVYSYPGVHIAMGPSFTIHEPFTVHLYLNSTVLDNRNVVYFNYSIPQILKSGTYDRVTFNSTYGVPSSFKTPQANFLVSGTSLTPTKYLLYDAELMIGGPGGGSTTTFYNINGNMSLMYLNDTSGTYDNVPSAYNFGTDTGETSSGVSIYWNAKDEACLNTGPSILEGMWGIQSNVGFISVSGNIAPTNAFVFINKGTAINNTTTQWAPVPVTGNFKFLLSPGSYRGQILASDYKPYYGLNISGSSGVTILISPINLQKNVSYGGYTPLFAFSNSQLVNITTGGNGTAASPYIPIAPNHYIDPIFGQVNDFEFPVFPGMFLKGTTAYVSTFGELQPSINLSYNGYVFLTTTMPYFFFSAQNVSVIGMHISGFLYPASLAFLAGELTFWNSSNDLISHSCFCNTPVAFVANSSMDITVANNVIYSTTVYSAYGNTNFANNLLEGSCINDYHSTDNLVGNVFEPTVEVHSSEFVYKSSVNLQGNTFVNGQLMAYNSSLMGSGNVLNDTCMASTNAHTSLSNGAILGSLMLSDNSTSVISASSVVNSGLVYISGSNSINKSNIEDSFMCSTMSNLYINGTYINGTISHYSDISARMGSVSLTHANLNYTNTIGMCTNFSLMQSNATGFLYMSLNTNNTITSSHVASGMNSPWVITTYYGKNNFVNDNFATGNFTVNKADYSSDSSEFNLNSVTFTDGINSVNHSNFSTINGNQASNLVLQYGDNTVTKNTFFSQNVSLYKNLYKAGTSLIVYGGVNVISDNVFISSNSPASSSFLKYGDASSQVENTFLYSVKFTESGLTTGAQWTLFLNGKTYSSSTSSIAVLLSSGNYTYVANSSGYVGITKSFSVVSSSVAVPISFHAEPKYAVIFNEKNLPNGTTWQVMLNGNTASGNGTSISFYIYNGTFSYSIMGVKGYFASPSSGTITVNGASLTVNISWHKHNYPVTFVSSGLAKGTSWGVNVNGVAYTSTASAIVVDLPNGTYSYSVMAISGYTPTMYSGSITVDGSSVTVTVAYTTNTYTVQFTESGLPAGTTWSVTLGGKTISTNGTMIIFTNLSNGVYSYKLSDPSGFTYTSSGTVSVSNSGATIAVPFVKQVNNTLPIIYGVVAGVVAGVVTTVAAIVFSRAKKH